MANKTYTITAFNHRIHMNAVINYYPITSKRQALDIATRMVDTGAKNVKMTFGRRPMVGVPKTSPGMMQPTISKLPTKPTQEGRNAPPAYKLPST